MRMSAVRVSSRPRLSCFLTNPSFLAWLLPSSTRNKRDAAVNPVLVPELRDTWKETSSATCQSPGREGGWSAIDRVQRNHKVGLYVEGGGGVNQVNNGADIWGEGPTPAEQPAQHICRRRICQRKMWNLTWWVLGNKESDAHPLPFLLRFNLEYTSRQYHHFFF